MAHDLAQQVQRRATRMHEMVERQGVDVSKLVRLSSGDAYMEARRRCLKCCATQECLLWLDAKPPVQVALISVPISIYSIPAKAAKILAEN